MNRCCEKITFHVKVCTFLVKNQELRPEVHGLARKTEKSQNQVPNQVPGSIKISKPDSEPGSLNPGRFLVKAWRFRFWSPSTWVTCLAWCSAGHWAERCIPLEFFQKLLQRWQTFHRYLIQQETRIPPRLMIQNPTLTWQPCSEQKVGPSTDYLMFNHSDSDDEDITVPDDLQAQSFPHNMTMRAPFFGVWLPDPLWPATNLAYIFFFLEPYNEISRNQINRLSPPKLYSSSRLKLKKLKPVLIPKTYISMYFVTSDVIVWHHMTSDDSRCHLMTSDVKNVLIYMFLESAQHF